MLICCEFIHEWTQIAYLKPKAHFFVPFMVSWAALHVFMPMYSALSPAQSFEPAHARKATFGFTSTPTLPKMFAIFSAQEAPPATHPFVGTSPFTTALAKASHPASPHPPQFAPLRASRTS